MDYFKEMYHMQAQLDQHIIENHQLKNRIVFNEKILALLVELGELANETRCFKFWSLKGPSEEATILEEFVDGIHFILSIGLDLNYQDLPVVEPEPVLTDLTVQFLNVYQAVNQLLNEVNATNYLHVIHVFLSLGRLLGFNTEKIYQAYVLKNDENHRRQENHY